MRVLHFPSTVVDTLLSRSSHPAAGPVAAPRPSLVRQDRSVRLEHTPPASTSSSQQPDDMNWMDELERHIVQSLTEDAAVSQASSDEDASDDEMDVIDLTPPKPSLPTRTESIPVPLLLPTSTLPSSPEVEETEDEEEEEDEDEDEDMTESFQERCSSAFATGRHHGYSRSALHNIKEFWSSRHDEWIKFNAYHATSRAYDGIVKSPRPSLKLDTNFFSSNASTPALSPSSVTSEESQTPTPRTPSPSLDPSLPIFPRVGDLSHLRDPRPAMIDRAFCHVPLYSICKMIFVHELSHTRTPSASSEDVTHDATAMSIYSDDGTLVDEETSAEKKGAAAGGSVDWLGRWKVIAEKLGARPEDDPAHIDGPFSASLSSEGLSWADEVQRNSNARSGRKFFFALDDDDFSDRDFDDDDDDYGIEVAKGRTSFGAAAGAGHDWGRGYVSDFEMLF
ncbi:hypothetical protein EUX98_g4874 [Antrodiella citrinella]|uniref:Uncharacterized protein n=1 Tax=Antrodiella citrinella TaxID=2447956 RepID=A0A4S4MT18_9APHY|nr:hypothetical protein EUX98_g4874 [Antrodiella citrinella]